MYGSPALKLDGRLLACLPIHRSAEPESLVVRTDFDQRAALLAEERKVGWTIGLACILCAAFVLIPLGRTLESWRIASQTYLATSLSDETQSWPVEPNIGGSSPTFKDPFASWAPRAVLEQFPTPRTMLAHLPQTSAARAELVNPQ